MKVLTEFGNISQGLLPALAAMNTSSDIYNLQSYNAITFILYKAAGAVGTATITVDACNDTTPSNTAKCAYFYRRFDSASGEWSALTARSSVQNFVTSAQINDVYEITVDPRELHSVVVNGTTGHHYCRLSIVQSDATAVLHGVLVLLGQPRYGQNDPIDPLV